MDKGINAFRTLRVLHLSLLAGPTAFAIISLVATNKGLIMVADESLSRNLQVFSVIFSLALLLPGFNLFKKKITAVRNSDGPAEQRMKQYTTACIIWWAMIEAPGIFAMVGYLLTANLSFFFLAIFHIIILFVFMPRKENIIVLLKLNKEEISQLEGRI